MGSAIQKDIDLKIKEILNSDEGNYGYLFPYRNKVPKIVNHPFATLDKTTKVDEFVVKQMLDIRYIGWTAKILLNVNLFPEQIRNLQLLWTHPFSMLIASRGGAKSFLLAVYSILKCLLEPGTKIAIVGAGLRQAKLVFSYIENIWHSSPMLRSIIGGGQKGGPKQSVDICYFRIGSSIINALPLGNGEKIRGFRANVVIADEFASIPEDVFDIVVRGFAASAKSPLEAAKYLSVQKRLMEAGLSKSGLDQMLYDQLKSNQIIYSGTAYYAFNHFAKRYDMFKKIIMSKGDKNKIADVFGSEYNIPDNFDYRDYVIIRLPYTHVQPGLMDMKMLANAKATLPKNIFLMEYAACFVKDSNGIYPRSLIEACTCTPSIPIKTPDGDVIFSPLMKGVQGRRYVMGLDPAAERDNLAITILEIWPNHYRVVFSYAINKPEYERRKKNGLIESADYYEYCVHRIKELSRLFFVERICMDMGGGGKAISEMLRNKSLCRPGEQPIYECVVTDKPKDTDSLTDGPHILKLVYQSPEWNSESNLVMHKSFETKRLLFPAFDTIKMQSALMAEKAAKITFDTYEDVVNGIEELKNELCTIQMTVTPTGKEHFDTPSKSVPGATEGQKRRGRLRKDRYTSLLLAHREVYDSEIKIEPKIDYEDVAGNIMQVESDPTEGLYRGRIGSFHNSSDWLNQDPGTCAIKRGSRL